MAVAKNIYKVWIKPTQKFYSTNKKASWTSESWALNAAFDASRVYGKDNIEIHVFPVASAERISYNDYLVKYKEKTEEANQLKAEREKKQKERYKKEVVKLAKDKIAELEKFIKENDG